jgi:hypothetical protein
MRKTGLTAAAIVAVALLTGPRGTGAEDQGPDRHQGCSEKTLRGSYGIQVQGTRPAPPPAPPGTMETVIGVIVRHYDGDGNFTQVGNEKGSVSGSAPVDREGAGTYQVNEDCTGTHQWQLTGSAITLTDRFVIVDRGREVRNFVVSPAPVMVTGVSRKIGIR